MFRVSGYRDIKFLDLPEIDLPGSYKLLTAPLLVSSQTLCFFVDLSVSLSLSAAHWNAHRRTYVAISHLCHDFHDGFAAESSSQRSSLSRPSVSGSRFR